MSDPNTPGSPTPDPARQPAPPPAAYPPAGPAAPPAYGAAQPAYEAAPPAYPAAPGYGAAPAYGGYPAAPKTNTLAVVSLISSIAGVLIIYFIGSIVGIVTGHISLSQLKTSGEGGRGLAIAGLIVGYVGLALTIIATIVFIAFWGWFIASVEQFPST